MPVSQKVLVTQLRDLARDPEHQSALVSNSECLKSLTQTLSATDMEVVIITLDTLKIVSQTPAHRKILAEVPNLITTLCFLQDHPNRSINNVAQEILDNVEPAGSVMSGDSGVSGGGSLRSFGSKGTNSYIPRSLHVITLKIGNIRSADQRESLVSTAVSFQGIVSVTMDSRFQRATFYSTMPDIRSDLISLLTKRGFQCLEDDVHMYKRSMYKRSAYREPFGGAISDRSSNISKEDLKGPSYLEPSNYGQGNSRYNSRQLGRYTGGKNESLADRVKRIKEERESKKPESIATKLWSVIGY